MTDTNSPADWRAYLEQSRAARREYFGHSPRSPLPPEMKGDAFPGLAYYPPDPEYRFVLPLAEHDHKKTVTVETTADGKRQYLRWGAFTIDLAETTVTLQAYRPDRSTDRLWVPFRDATSGTETYGAGRYLDLEPGEHFINGEWILDFNEAYNPTCAYSGAYECPMVPSENWLEVPIEAGEKDFPGEPADPHGHGH